MGNRVASGKVAKKAKAAAKPPKSPAKGAAEIDDIFAAKPAAAAPEPAAQPQPQAKPAKAQVTVVDASAAGRPDQQRQKQRQPRPPADDGFGDSRGKNTKYTEDGMRVYYMDDLRIGEGNGDTEACPFDCQCCF